MRCGAKSQEKQPSLESCIPQYSTSDGDIIGVSQLNLLQSVWLSYIWSIADTFCEIGPRFERVEPQGSRV